MSRVLMVAFHYPPQKGSSGLQRTLKFSRYLLKSGWQPQVLTVHPRAHRETSDELVAEIPGEVRVERAFVLDTMRHIAIAGRYPGWLALPDQWVSWVFGAVPAGLRLIRSCRPGLIWSTFPIATAHLIGFLLKRMTGLPWIADFRDPMVEGDIYPADPTVRKVRLWIERKTFRYADLIVVTTEGLARTYRIQYPDARIEVIPNGFDEENFSACTAPTRATQDRPVTLIHSGLLYPHERNPSDLFAALRDLKQVGRVTPKTLQVRLRATGHDEFLRGLLEEFDIVDLVSLEPAIGHREALDEMMAADGLLIMQAASCNQQIPAKLYEYLRAQRPILALTDRAGDTACALLGLGLDDIAPLDDPQEIGFLLLKFIDAVRAGQIRVANIEQLGKFSREAQAGQLAALFDRTVEQ